jgi:hypothetical protein
MGLQGLAYYGIVLLYSLPAWLLWAAVVVIVFGGGVILAWLVEVLEGGGASAIGQDLAPLLLIGSFGLATILASAVSLLIGFVYPMAIGRYVEARRFSAAFEFGAVWLAVRANLGGLVVAWLFVLVLNLVVGTIVGLLSVILCCIPFVGYLLMAPVSFYVSLVQARLMGQVYHEAQRRLKRAAIAAAEAQPAELVTVLPELEERAEEPAERPPQDAPKARETSIESLGLSTRVLRLLQGAGITTVDQVLERLAQGDAALLAVQGLGPMALHEIKAQLGAQGYLASS